MVAEHLSKMINGRLVNLKDCVETIKKSKSTEEEPFEGEVKAHELYD